MSWMQIINNSDSHSVISSRVGINLNTDNNKNSIFKASKKV